MSIICRRIVTGSVITRTNAVGPRVLAAGAGADADQRLGKRLQPVPLLFGSALSHRAVITEAQQQSLDNVLVVEDDALCLDGALKILTDSVAELRQPRWSLFYLGGDRRGQACPPVEGCAHLSVPTDLTGAPGVAYARSVFETILTDLPGSPQGMTSWLEARCGLARYLAGIDRQFICEPSVATTIELLPLEPEELRHRFILGEQAG